MQAFYIRSGVGEASCVDAPESGVLIQTPEGVQSVHFRINGVDVEIGSTVMLQAQPEGAFRIRTLEGAAVVTLGGNAYPVIAGTEMSLPMDAQLQPVGLPSLPVPLSDIRLETLPLAPLPQAIPPAAPLSDAVAMKLQMRVKAGLPPCGVPGLPDCEHALTPEEQRTWASEAAYQEPESTPTPKPTLETVDPQATAEAASTEAEPLSQDGTSTDPASSPTGADNTSTSSGGEAVNPIPSQTPDVGSAPASDPSGGETKAEKEKKEKDKKEKKDKKDHPGPPPPPGGQPPAPPPPAPGGQPPAPPPGPQTQPPAPPPPPGGGPGPGPDKPGPGKKDK